MNSIDVEDKGVDIYYYYRQQSTRHGILNCHCRSVFFNKRLNNITLKLVNKPSIKINIGAYSENSY